MEKVLWLIEWSCEKWLSKFHAGDFSLLDDAPWLGRPAGVDSDRDTNWEQSMLYHVGDSQHTQNIQIKCWKSFAPAWLCSLLWCLGST